MANGGRRPGAGRKKGSKASHTLEAAKFREELVRRVIAEKGPIIDALIARAKEGDVRALSEVLDRVVGKVTQPVDLDPEEMGFTIKIETIKNENRGLETDREAE